MSCSWTTTPSAACQKRCRSSPPCRCLTCMPAPSMACPVRCSR
eukprot:jgi/Astpho2/8747/gw1.00128.115.1_t